MISFGTNRQRGPVGQRTISSRCWAVSSKNSRPGTGIFWKKRSEFQSKIDEYYTKKRGAGWTPNAASADQDARDLAEFLVEVGYLSPEGQIDFRMTVPQLDPDMDQNGPELVTPVTNASMAVGGANARWGSLYDAYFLSDIRPEIDRDSQRTQRLRMVVEDTNAFLDNYVAGWEEGAVFGDITGYSLSPNSQGNQDLVGHTSDGKQIGLREPNKFLGYNLDEAGPTLRVLPGRQRIKNPVPSV